MMKSLRFVAKNPKYFFRLFVVCLAITALLLIATTRTTVVEERNSVVELNNKDASGAPAPAVKNPGGLKNEKNRRKQQTSEGKKEALILKKHLDEDSPEYVEREELMRHDVMEVCESLQSTIRDNGWDYLDENDRDRWEQDRCEEVLPVFPPMNTGKTEICLLVANGPSLRQQTWDFLGQIDHVIGLNKIFLGINKFSLPLDSYAVINSLVAEQSVQEIEETLHPDTVKYITERKKNLFTAGRGDEVFLKSIAAPEFSRRLKKGVFEGWTVTYVAFQILYEVGCRNVVVVGMDHNFNQSGSPNEEQEMTGDDPNHFDSKYFKDKVWNLADIENSEKYYAVARDTYAKDGRQIIDATIGGKCTIFKKVDGIQEALALIQEGKTPQ
eukprot:Clim_evm10s170 gene=Clim_evmTU10s170